MTFTIYCSHCKVAFQVKHEELKKHNGLVRCFACKQIFNPIFDSSQPTTNLLDSTSYVLPKLAPGSADGISIHSTADIFTTHVFSVKKTEKKSSQQKQLSETSPSASSHPSLRLRKQARMIAIKAVSKTPDEDHNEKRKTTKAKKEAVKWRFMRQAMRQKRFRHFLDGVTVFGIVPLGLMLLWQISYFSGNELAVRYPPLKPLLVNICQAMGCKLTLPMDIDQLSIESDQLEKVDSVGQVYTLDMLLRNRSTVAQGWPSIELTLNDQNEQVAVRRVFFPEDYLFSQENNLNDLHAQGFLPKNEQLIHIDFELKDKKATGYLLYLFYP